MTDSEAVELLASVKQVVVCRGKKTSSLEASEATPEDLKGPTGNIRAPLLQVNGTLIVGFSATALADHLG